jgi:aminopeptidase YwaD
MRLKISFVVFFLCVQVFSVAQDLKRVQQTIKQLTSKKFHGRGAAFDGDKLASEYIAQQFHELGLVSQIKDYFQPFSYGVNMFDGSMKLKSNLKHFKPGIDFIVRPSCGSGKGTYPVFFVDTLVFTNDAALANFLKKDVTHTVLVYNKKLLVDFNKSTTDLLKQLYSAAAIIELQDGKLTMSITDQSFGTPVFEVLTHVFSKETKTIHFDVDTKIEPKHIARNVIGMIEGSEKTDSFIVISAHYDHLGTLGKRTYFPGANDNASGVSMLLELAHHYSMHKPKYSMLFIAFAGEESGLIGSSYYVGKPTIELASIHFLINLDLLGTGDAGIMVVNGSVFKKEFNQLLVINEERKLVPIIKMRGEAANSDHYPFYKRNVPCFFIYTLGGITAYHDVKDIAKTLPLTKYSEVFELIVLFTDQQ